MWYIVLWKEMYVQKNKQNRQSSIFRPHEGLVYLGQLPDDHNLLCDCVHEMVSDVHDASL